MIDTFEENKLKINHLFECFEELNKFNGLKDKKKN